MSEGIPAGGGGGIITGNQNKIKFILSAYLHVILFVFLLIVSCR